MKNHIKKDKYNTFDETINSMIQEALESPYGQLGYSIGLTGNIESKEYVSQFISQCQPCSCKSDEEHKAKRETYKKSHPPQPLDLETIKDRIGGNEKYHRLFLKMFCDKIEPKQVGRPPKPKKVGRPFKSASNNAPLITALNTKTLYLPNQEKMMASLKEIVAIVCDCSGMTETQFRRRYRMIEKRLQLIILPLIETLIEKRWGLINPFSSFRLPLPQSLP